MVASSTMLVLNKVAISEVPRPAFLLFLQLAFTSATVSIAHDLKIIKLTEFSLDVLKRFWLVPVTFLMSIFFNIKILTHTNIETFIVLRASTPVVLAVLDVQFLNRALPERRTWVSILGVLVCACGYIHFESNELNYDSGIWIVLWYSVFCFDQIYIKYVVETVQMTMWDRVWYSNTFPFMLSA
jgi:GDP-mannose transporter